MYIPCKMVERVERLVQLTLKKCRYVESCGECEHTHIEWFKVEEETARKVIDMWAKFARSSPYNERGQLSEFWFKEANSKRWPATGNVGLKEVTEWVNGNTVGKKLAPVPGYLPKADSF